MNEEPGPFQAELERLLADVIVEASKWSPGSSVRPPGLRDSLEAVIRHAMADRPASQPSPAPRLTPEEQAVLDACEARFRRIMVDFGHERVMDVADDAVSWKPDAQALLSATRDWLLKRAADNGDAPQPSPQNARQEDNK